MGTFGSIPAAYVSKGKLLRGAIAHGWAVDPAYRSSSLLLPTEFFRQSGVDIFIDTTASADAARIFKAFKARPTQPDSEQDFLLWITSYGGFARSVLHFKAPRLAGVGKLPLALALRCQDFLRGRRRNRMDGRIERLTEFDERFEAFWQRLRNEHSGLLAVRDRATLTWHFKDQMQRDAVRILALQDAGTIAGYCVLVRSEDARTDFCRYRVADVQVVGGAETAIETLLGAALRLAADERIDLVEVYGLSPAKRQALRRLRPRTRSSPIHHFVYRIKDPALAAELGPPGFADCSLYDGDATL